MGIGAALVSSALGAAAIDAALIGGGLAAAANQADTPEVSMPDTKTTTEAAAGVGGDVKTSEGVDTERDTTRRKRQTGTRGLQIPLQTAQSTTAPATTGINI